MKFIISVFLSIIFACVPCFAYTADSFVIDTDPYVFKKVQSSSLMSASPVMLVDYLSSSEDNTQNSIVGYDFVKQFKPLTIGFNYTAETWGDLIVRNFATTFPRSEVDVFESSYTYGDLSFYNFADSTELVEIYHDTEDYDIVNRALRFPIYYPTQEISPNLYIGTHPVVQSLDLSSFDPFYSFSLSGGFNYRCYLQNGSSGSVLGYAHPAKIEVYVNGSNVLSLNPDSDHFFNFNDFIYSSVTPISSISFSIYFDDLLILSDPLFTTYNCVIETIFYTDNPVRLDTLLYNPAIDDFNDTAQDEINQHNQIESQWTGSMSQNFDSLNLDTFTFPAGAASAFSLISGIFTDLWNSMGDFKIAYVFPLYLGIVLLLVGRISKFSGGRSSSGKGKGDDSA